MTRLLTQISPALLLPLVVFSILCQPVLGQWTYRYGLVEHFTSANSAACAQYNPGHYYLLDQNADNVHWITYSTAFAPDTFYNYNPGGNMARSVYYNVGAVPHDFLNGSFHAAHPQNFSQLTINSVHSYNSPLKVCVEEVTLGMTRKVTVKLKATAAPPFGNFYLNVVVVEDNIQFSQPPGTNGEIHFRNVFRRFASAENGDYITLPANGDSLQLSYVYTLDPNWDHNEVYAIAFVQESATQEVLNSGSSRDKHLSTSQSIDPPQCFNWCNGSVTVNVLDGVSPFYYNWAHGASTGQLTNLCMGQYTVTVMDAHFETQVQVFNVSQPTAIASTTTTTNASCAFTCDGRVDLHVSGGTAPYTFSIDGVVYQNQPSFSNLCPGNYSITMVDAQNCAQAQSVTVGQPTPMDFTFAVSDATCITCWDGEVDLNVLGGVFPFNYSWSHGPLTQDLTGLGAGTYHVTVTDASGCQATAKVDVHYFSCKPPNALWANPVSISAATLNWSTAAGADFYLLRGRRLGSANWLQMQVPAMNGTSQNVYNLLPNTTYEWQVNTVCNYGGIDSSGWSQTNQFTTTCISTDSIWVSQTGSNGAVLNWHNVAGVYSYQIIGRRLGSQAWSQIQAPSNTSQRQVFGLHPDTEYEWTVRTWCDALGSFQSGYASFDTFTTLSPQRIGSFDPLPFDKKASFQLYPNPTRGKVKVALRNWVEGQTNILLYSQSGQLVKRKTLSDDFELNVRGLQAGVYLIHIEGTDYMPQKLVIW